MAKETIIINNSNEFRQGERYQSIPRMVSEESSLLHAAVDQDLRNMRRGNFRRNLLGLATLFLLVGAFGISSNRSRSSAQANLLRTTSNTEETQAVVVYSKDTIDEGQTSSFDVMVASSDSNRLSIESTSGCKGNIPFPNLPNFDVGAQVACDGGLAVARGWFSNSLGTVLGKAFENKNVLLTGLTAIFGTGLGAILANGGVVAALVFAAVDATWEASCLASSNGKSSNALNIENIASISLNVVNQKLIERDTENFRILSDQLKRRSGNDLMLLELREFAEAYHKIAMASSFNTYEATRLASNAATASLTLIEAFRQHSIEMKDKECCEEAVKAIQHFRRDFATMYTHGLRKSFDDYKNEMLTESKYYEDRTKLWVCRNIIKGSHYYQYWASVNGNSGKKLATGASPSGVTGSCPSNASQFQKAKDDLKKKVVKIFDDWEKEIFNADVTKFYNDMAKEELDLTCDFAAVERA
jgi:hypothetical protein